MQKFLQLFNRRLAEDITETAEFKQWFEGSKVVNPDGSPLLLYHGTKKKVDTLNLKGTYYWGIYATALKEYARKYGPIILSLYMSIKNPLILHAGQDMSIEHGEIRLDREIVGFYRELDMDVISFLQQKGYDGIIVIYKGIYCFEAVAFSSDQVKIVSIEE